MSRFGALDAQTKGSLQDELLDLWTFEEAPETDGSGVGPNPSEGVRDEVRRPGQPEACEGVEYGTVSLGELDGDAAATAMAELATGGLGHGRSGFLTGSPQIGHGV